MPRLQEVACLAAVLVAAVVALLSLLPRRPSPFAQCHTHAPILVGTHHKTGTVLLQHIFKEACAILMWRCSFNHRPLPCSSPEEAVALVRQGNRSAGALTYGWPANGNPDPTGQRVKVLQSALAERPQIRGFFWDFASLHQPPRGGKRTKTEQAAFDRALSSMGDLYASAIGTLNT